MKFLALELMLLARSKLMSMKNCAFAHGGNTGISGGSTISHYADPLRAEVSKVVISCGEFTFRDIYSLDSPVSSYPAANATYVY